jgi:hypothetical protein
MGARLLMVRSRGIVEAQKRALKMALDSFQVSKALRSERRVIELGACKLPAVLKCQ